jgi:hypothetical protein
VKKRGEWFDKGFLVHREADRLGLRLLWHKIVCRYAPGTQTYGRAGYSHLLCFSRGVRHDLAASTPDVIASPGAMTWTRAIGLDACAVACRFVARRTASRTIIDPFCGVGTVLAVANSFGLDAIGVELNRKRAAQSRTLAVEDDGTGRLRVVAPARRTPPDDDAAQE